MEDLVWAVKNGDLDAVKSTVKSGFDINTEMMNGRTALHYAADYGQTSVVEYLVTEGKANVNLPDKHGITALLAAIYEDHVECVKILLSKGAKKDGKAPDGSSYVHCAQSDAVKALLK